jgi:hypothetical protein
MVRNAKTEPHPPGRPVSSQPLGFHRIADVGVGKQSWEGIGGWWSAPMSGGKGVVAPGGERRRGCWRRADGHKTVMSQISSRHIHLLDHRMLVVPKKRYNTTAPCFYVLGSSSTVLLELLKLVSVHVPRTKIQVIYFEFYLSLVELILQLFFSLKYNMFDPYDICYRPTTV